MLLTNYNITLEQKPDSASLPNKIAWKAAITRINGSDIDNVVNKP